MAGGTVVLIVVPMIAVKKQQKKYEIGSFEVTVCVLCQTVNRLIARQTVHKFFWESSFLSNGEDTNKEGSPSEDGVHQLVKYLKC